jgi:hypothetical protein
MYVYNNIILIFQQHFFTFFIFICGIVNKLKFRNNLWIEASNSPHRHIYIVALVDWYIIAIASQMCP